MKISSVESHRLATLEFAVFAKRVIRQTFIHGHELFFDFVDLLHIAFIEFEMGAELRVGQTRQGPEKS